MYIVTFDDDAASVEQLASSALKIATERHDNNFLLEFCDIHTLQVEMFEDVERHQRHNAVTAGRCLPQACALVLYADWLLKRARV